jgi:D-glycero-alpha-D-manno-heptose 1-phosphate guanylyltransferase
MEAVVLAGGFGTRLRSVVPDLPKPMAPVAGRPFLDILLTLLSRRGFDRIILSLGYMADKVISHFGERFAGMDLVYEVESRPLGTGGALKQALQRCNNDHVFVFNGDTFLDVDVAQIERLWGEYRDPIIVAVAVPDASRYGRLLIEEGFVAGFEEKGRSGSGLINAGCYVLPAEILAATQIGQHFSFESEFLQDAVRRQAFRAFVSSGDFIDIGVPEDYLRAQSQLAKYVANG